MHPQHDWAQVIDLIEGVVGEDDLLPSVVAGVRTMVREIGVLPPADIAGHTRVLLAAATRAIAARRRPTEAELSFVAELGTARARQGVPVEAVLGAIHVVERAIWSRARQRAARDGVPSGLLLDARELYDDWSDAVRARLIVAHRAAEVDPTRPAVERDEAVVRRLLEGGSVAALAAAEAGLPTAGGLWVLVARTGETYKRVHLQAHVDGLLVGVLTREPTLSTVAGRAGLAGPTGPEELAAARRLAAHALAAAEATGRTGLVHAADVATLAAINDRADLAAVLLARHQAAWEALGTGVEEVARAVCAWLEADRHVPSAAGPLFVHPNTVRNRVQRFTAATGIDPHTTFGGVDAWWLCHSWLTYQAT